MRRSQHTNYIYEETQIYEFKDFYFIFEECQQGAILNPLHGSRQLAPEYSALNSKLPLNYNTVEMGEAVLKALHDFDSRAHPFDKFDFSARNKTICQWVGARGINVFEKNSRLVQIIRHLEQNTLEIYPFDNCNENPWYGAIEEKKITLAGNACAFEVGKSVREAFMVATYHPDRKDPPISLLKLG